MPLLEQEIKTIRRRSAIVLTVALHLNILLRVAVSLSLALFLSLAVLLNLMTAQAIAQDNSYLVKFPSDKLLADLTLAEPGSWGHRNKPKMVVKARGNVRIPRSAQIKLDLLFDGPTNMNYFDQLGPEQVVRFSAAKLDFNDSQMAHLKRFPGMMVINLDSTIITDKSLPLMGTWQKLIICRLTNTDITGSGFSHLAHCRGLRSLSIEGITLKAGTLVQLAPLSPKLISLNVAHVGLTQPDVPAIARLVNLTNLDVDGNTHFDNKCLKMLLPLKHLKVINLADTAVNDQCLEDLSKFPELEAVTVRNRTFWRDGKPLPVKNKIKMYDCEEGHRMPMEMFSPLH